FHYVTSAESNSDTVMLRLIHNFGSSSGPGLGPFAVGGGGGGGGGGRRRAQNNINFGLNWSRSSNNLVNPLPSLAGTTGTQGLNDPTARRELDQTYSISETISWNRGKHNWRFGGDYRRILQSFRSARNAEGGFVFTGFATSQYPAGSTQPVTDTGYDFADFLLGFPRSEERRVGKE